MLITITLMNKHRQQALNVDVEGGSVCNMRSEWEGGGGWGKGWWCGSFLAEEPSPESGCEREAPLQSPKDAVNFRSPLGPPCGCATNATCDPKTLAEHVDLE